MLTGSLLVSVSNSPRAQAGRAHNAPHGGEPGANRGASGYACSCAAPAVTERGRNTTTETPGQTPHDRPASTRADAPVEAGSDRSPEPPVNPSVSLPRLTGAIMQGSGTDSSSADRAHGPVAGPDRPPAEPVEPIG